MSAETRRRRALRAIGMPFKTPRIADRPIDWTPRATIRLVGGGHVICLNYIRGVVEYATENSLKGSSPRGGG